MRLRYLVFNLATSIWIRTRWNWTKRIMDSVVTDEMAAGDE